MSLFSIYFIIAGAILLIKFLFGLCTFNRLKLFVNDHRHVINELMSQDSLKYSDLIIYHFATKSIKHSDYSTEMLELMIQGTCTADLALYFLFALFWVVSIPCVLLCLLYGWLETVFEKFSKTILS